MTKDNQFQVATTSLVLSVPPIFAGNPRGGVEEMLDSMIMRYIPALRGVVLSHSNLKFLNKIATIRGDSPFLVCAIAFDATVWSPRVGIKLLGRVNLCSPDHISLLVHRTFNVSIPRRHIPVEDWEFEYGTIENDPEFGHGQGEDFQDESTEEMNEETGGKWVHRVTGESLANKVVEFTVIGVTVANEMLSLLGSLQAEPFSAIHETEKAHGEISSEVSSSEDTFEPLGKIHEAKRRASRSQERTGSEKEKKRRK